jgi:predicted transcriptional regulator
MSAASVPKPTEAEIDILSILWETGPATVRQVHERISQTKPSQYTTTLKLLQIMTGKGLVERDETDRSHVYKARVQRKQLQRQLATTLMNRVFGGSVRDLLVGALGGRASREELAELKQLLKEYEKGGKR